MKKWALVFIVFLAAGVYLLWPKASIENPIILSAQMDEAAKTIAVSYLTTAKDKTYLMEVAVDKRGYYPAPTDKIGENRDTKVLASQNGYQLREDVIHLSERQLAYFDELSGRAPLAAISYENYTPIETILVILKKDEAAEGIIKENSLHYTFTAPETMSINTIGHYDSVATLRYLYNGSEPSFPIELKPGDTLNLFFDPPYKLASQDELLLEIETTDGKYYTKHLETTLEIPDGYLKQLADANH